MRIDPLGTPPPPSSLPPSSPAPVAADFRESAPAEATTAYTLPPEAPSARRAWVKATFEKANAELAAANPAGLAAKAAKMRTSLFSFFRGSATLFYLDLARHAPPSPGAPEVRMAGDVHAENFGTYRSAAGHLVYDLNDFDETADGGPFEWEVARAVTSWVVAARDAGRSDEHQEKVGRAFARAFAKQVHVFDDRGGAETYVVTTHTADGPVKDLLKRQAEADESKWVSKLIETAAGGGHRFVASDEVFPRPELKAPLLGASPRLASSGVEDVAAKQDSGTASLGLPRWYVLEHVSGGVDKVVEVKQQIRSALDGIPHITVRHDAARADQVANAARTLPAEPYPQIDTFHIAAAAVGAIPTGEGDASFLVRERPALKATVEEGKLDFHEMEQVAETQGRLLAAAMSRQPGKARALAAWLDANSRFVDDVVEASRGAADRAEADYRAFKKG